MPPVKRWDYVWKELCDPRNSWGAVTLKRLLGTKYGDYYVKFSESPLDTELHDDFGKNVIYADKVLVAKIDNVSHVVHIEFQSVPDDEIGFRMLQYDIRLSNKSTKVHDGYEVVTFPDSIIVSVRDSRLSTLTEYNVGISLWGHETLLSYPVVNALDKVPEIRGIMEAATHAEIQQAIQGFLEVIPGLSVREEKKFYRICSMLYNSKLYDASGITDEEVDTMAQIFEKDFKSQADILREEGHRKGREEGRREGRDEAIRSIMRQMNMPYEQAEQFLFPNGSSGTNMSRMHLQ